MAVHTFNPSTQEAEAGGYLLRSLVYRVSSRTDQATQRNPVLEKEKKKRKKKKILKEKI